MPQPQASTSAPKPSPSVSQPSQYFRSPSQNRPHDPPGQAAGLVLPQLSLPHVLHPPHPPNTGSTQEQHPTQRTPPAPIDGKDYLRARPGPGDFCVIAEAAKRAQLEVLMRDLSEVAL